MTRAPVRSIALTSAALCAGALLLPSACNHAWDALDPTSSSSSGAGGGGSTASSTSRASSSSSSSGSGASTSTSTGGGGSAPVHCGGANLLAWDFTSEPPDVFNMDTGAQLVDGECVMTPDANSSSWDTEGIYTEHAYDLRGAHVSIKVDEVPDQTAETHAGIDLHYDNDDDVFLDLYKSQLRCGFNRGGSDVIPMQVTYDATKHRYWRIREEGGTIHCATSPDGTTWTESGSFDITASLLGVPSSIHVQISATTADHVAMPGSFRVDDLNGGGAPTGNWCKATSFTDDFPAGTMTPAPGWDRSWVGGNGESVDQDGGTLNFHFGAAGGNDAGYQSSAAYDMTGQRVAIEVLKLPALKAGTPFFSVGNNQHADVYWNLNSDGFGCYYDTPDNTQPIWEGQAPSLPAWVGFRESGGRVYCEILQGSTWTSFGSETDAFDPTRVDIVVGISSGSDAPAGTYVASFDKLNLEQ